MLKSELKIKQMIKSKISDELYNLISDNDYIKEVHFTKANQHYLNVHELKVNGVGTGKFYGYLKLEQVYSHSEGERKFYKMVQVANPPVLIVETVSRDQILKFYWLQEPAKISKS
ncbi:MAG TPA: hypothetical protein VKR58_13690 [Aquella sp.]|nr:hypothetical protein [Aquella sp.]